MIAKIAQRILEDPATSFILGLIIVAVIGFVTRNYIAKKKQ